MKKKEPNYKKIYTDIIHFKHPEKSEACKKILDKETLGILDILNLNDILFQTSQDTFMNQKLKSYDRDTIFAILDYQKKNKLNNNQIAMHFKLSRNTITKWKKIFISHQTLS